jgi:Ni/Co efflux regulator RcnB
MTKLTLAALAAGAAMFAAPASAQPPQSAPPPPPPAAHMPPPGVTWHHGSAPGDHVGSHMGGHFSRHLERGFIVPPVFFGPQFTIGDWQAYGFAAPGADQRWIRYYDDAYLIDRDGRIVDSRDDIEWDRHGDRWADGYGGDARVRTYVYGAPGYPPPPPAYGYGGAYGGYGYYGGSYGGYGYGYAYPIIIETTVTGGGGGYVEEVTEELERVQTPRRVRHRAAPRCICRAPAPRPHPRPRPHRAPTPPPGERG